MDISDGYEGLDFGLGDPGLVEDTRAEEAAAQHGIDSHEVALLAALAQFDQARTAGAAAVACVIRLSQTDPLSDAARLVARARVLNRLQAAVRTPDVCATSSNGDFALTLAGCDIDAARKRMGLLFKLIEIEATSAGAAPALWAGLAPIGTDAAVAVRTARLACELAAFQASGHVETIDL